MGLYLYYWNYKHWLLIRGQRGFRLVPLLCTIFGAFTIYFLMKRSSIAAAKRTSRSKVMRSVSL